MRFEVVIEGAEGLQRQVWEGEDQQAVTARALLSGQKLKSVRPLDASVTTTRSPRRGQRVPWLKLEETAALLAELGMMLRAGLPLLEALQVMHAGSPHWMGLWRNGVRQGAGLSDLLQRHPPTREDLSDIWPLLRKGEQIGRLHQALTQAASMLERRARLRQEWTNALIYPLILLGASLAAVMLILRYVLPSFASMMGRLEGSLPWHTRALFALSDWVVHNDLAAALGLGALALLLLWAIRKGLGRRLLALPGPWQKGLTQVALSQVLSGLGDLLAGGVSLLAALELSLEPFRRLGRQKQVADVLGRVRRGEPLSEAFGAQEGVFAPTVLGLIRAAEGSATLAESLQELGARQAAQVQLRLRRLLSLAEPLMIVVVSLFVGMVVFSIVPVILGLSDIQ